ncbi:ATP-dependent RNA helicase p62-like [Brevipalpus obovatus]|uniref:ATP-dependent RNA helicase p62-like n=1 Tax=Brevipalpus obovatus TaxID=246614 RepID=UPI003D9DDF46
MIYFRSYFLRSCKPSKTCYHQVVDQIINRASLCTVKTCESEPPILDSSVNHDKDSPKSEFDSIFLNGEDVPPPVNDVASCNWPKYILDYLDRKKITKLTPIQSYGWPVALANRDMVGVARTGSGKTLAYLLPGLVHIDKRLEENRTYKGPKALVLLPTRELTQQVERVSLDIGHYRPVSLYGGTDRTVQNSILKTTTPELIFATPGRLNDFLDAKVLELKDVTYLVLDEADRMLEMGFEPEIKRIIKRTYREKRQTLMWSATWPDEVKNLAIDFMERPIEIRVGSEEAYANPNIKQSIIFCDMDQKEKKLIDLIREIIGKGDDPSYNRILIFASQKNRVDYLVRLLTSYGHQALGLHGDKPQSSRDYIMDGFRRGDRRIMVATDVASRGIDIQSIKHVISYDMPQVIEDYIHRIGRTGRVEKEGFSYAFFTITDLRLAKDLLEVLKRNNQEIPDRLDEIARRAARELNRKARSFSRFSPTPYYDTNRPGQVYSNFRRRFSCFCAPFRE